MRQTGDRLHDRTKGLVIAVRPAVTETGHRDVDEVRPDAAHRVVGEAPAFQYPGGEVLQHTVRDGKQRREEAATLAGTHIERDAALIAVEVVEVAGAIVGIL